MTALHHAASQAGTRLWLHNTLSLSHSAALTVLHTLYCPCVRHTLYITLRNLMQQPAAAPAAAAPAWLHSGLLVPRALPG
jgi:hypothetical protein